MTSTTTTLDALRTLFNSRASMRDFEDTPVPDDVLADILRLTQRAPTAFNTQSYVAIVVRANDAKAQLASAMLTTNQIKVSSAPLAVVFAADLEPSKNVPRIRELKLADGFPVDFVDRLGMYLKTFSGEGTEHGSMAWAYKQTTFASAAFLYAAAAHGLVTCPMEGFDEGAVRAAVGLPERYSVPIVISLGYPKQGVAPRVSNRLEPTEVFFDGRFGVSMDELFKAN